MKEVESAVVIDPGNIFDALAQTVIKELGPDEMTRQRFADKYGVTLGAALSVLEKAVKDGKLKRERRRIFTDTNSSYIMVYIPVTQ